MNKQLTRVIYIILTVMARFGPGVGGGAMAMIPSAAKLRARFRGKLLYQISPHQTLPAKPRHLRH